MTTPTLFAFKAGLLVIGLVMVAGLLHGAEDATGSVAPAQITQRPHYTQPISPTPVPDTGGPLVAPTLQQDPPPPPPGGILERFITLVINFPANKIKEAIRKALLGILQGEAKLLKDGLIGMASVTIFQTEAPSNESADVFGRINVSATLRSMENVLTMVAIPIWGLSLSMLALAIVLRNATMSGYDLGDIAYEFMRWGLICFCSGNGMGIANLIHIGFNLLAEAVLNKSGVNASNFIDALIPVAAIQLQTFPLVILIVMMVVSAVIVIVMALSYIARAVLVLAFVGLAPLAIATEGIPFTRFVFREWLGTFLRIELLQIINAFAYLLWARVLANMAAGAGEYGRLLQMERMKMSYLGPILLSSLAAVGLASVIIAINWSVFKFVFGVAIEVANGLQRAAGSVLGFLTTAMSGSPPSPMLAMGGAATGSSLLQGMSNGQRLGQQQHQIAAGQTPEQQRQRDRADAASQRKAATERADSSAASRKASEEKRDAGYQARAKQQQSRAMARDAGARSEGEMDSVTSAYGQLAEKYGEAAAGRAMKSAAGYTSEQARQHGQRSGNGLSKAAHALGARSAGAFAGGAAEDVILAEQGRSDTQDSQRVFPSLARATSTSQAQQGSAGSNNRAQSKSALGDNRNRTEASQAQPAQRQPDSQPTASQPNVKDTARIGQGSRQEQLVSMARNTGARGGSEIESVIGAHQSLAERYGEDAATQGVQAVSSQTRAQAKQQGQHKGGLARAAKASGASSAGQFVGRAAESAILKSQGEAAANNEQRVFPLSGDENAAGANTSGASTTQTQDSSSPSPNNLKSDQSGSSLSGGGAANGQQSQASAQPSAKTKAKPNTSLQQKPTAQTKQAQSASSLPSGQQATTQEGTQSSPSASPATTANTSVGSAGQTSQSSGAAQSATTQPNRTDALMSQQPNIARGDWNQTSWFDHLSANQVVQAIHGDAASAPQFADMMRDIRQLPASMSAGSGAGDEGLFKRVITGADAIGKRTFDPQQAYGQFQTFVDGELQRQGETSQVRVPWRAESPPQVSSSPTTGTPQTEAKPSPPPTPKQAQRQPQKRKP